MAAHEDTAPKGTEDRRTPNGGDTAPKGTEDRRTPNGGDTEQKGR